MAEPISTNVNNVIEIKNFDDLTNSDYCMMYFRTGCRHAKHSRGLCVHHYNVFVYRVRKGYITWDKLESQCRSLPAARDEFERIMKD